MTVENRVFVTEYNGHMYTPTGTLEDHATELEARLGRRPTAEGLYSVITKVTGEDGKRAAVLNFHPVSDRTPADSTIDIESAGIMMSGSARQTWPIGFTSIFGPAGKGKSLLGPHLASSLRAPFVKFGEPGPDTLPFNPVIHCAMLNRMLLTASEQTFVVDSMRMATLGGTRLGPGGIPRDMGFQISQIDYAARLAGKAIFGITNLLTDDERALSSAFEVISGSCTAVINITDIKVSPQDFKITGQLMMRPAFRGRNSFNLTIERIR
jgi:hypothetical protein